MWQQLVAAQIERIESELGDAIAGAPPDALAVRVTPHANPVGWLAWHLTRSHDRNVSEIAGVGQRWIDGGWHERFEMPADPGDTGYGHSDEQVAAFPSVDGDLVVGYHREVVAMIGAYLAAAPDDDLDRIAPSPTLGTADTVRCRLVGVLSEGFQHLGQIRLTC